MQQQRQIQPQLEREQGLEGGALVAGSHRVPVLPAHRQPVSNVTSSILLSNAMALSDEGMLAALPGSGVLHQPLDPRGHQLGHAVRNGSLVSTVKLLLQHGASVAVHHFHSTMLHGRVQALEVRSLGSRRCCWAARRRRRTGVITTTGAQGV